MQCMRIDAAWGWDERHWEQTRASNGSAGLRRYATRLVERGLGSGPRWEAVTQSAWIRGERCYLLNTTLDKSASDSVAPWMRRREICHAWRRPGGEASTLAFCQGYSFITPSHLAKTIPFIIFQVIGEPKKRETRRPMRWIDPYVSKQFPCLANGAFPVPAETARQGGRRSIGSCLLGFQSFTLEDSMVEHLEEISPSFGQTGNG